MADDEPNLGARVDKLAESTQQLATAYEDENKKRDERIRWSQRAVRWAIVVSCLAVVGAVVAIVVAVIATNALTTYKHDTQKARVASCQQFNQQQVRARAAFKDTAAILVATVENPTAKQKADIARYLAANNAKAAVDFPDRDCSSSGIATFLGQTARKP